MDSGLRKGERDMREAHTHKKKALGGHGEKAAICQPRREVSLETHPTDLDLALWAL
jgi:hypothetical protein